MNARKIEVAQRELYTLTVNEAEGRKSEEGKEEEVG